jgi:hypothetical protein
VNAEPLERLAERWREEADRYAGDGAIVPADRLLRRVASELTAAWQDWQTEQLDTAQAAHESGYSEARLRELVREGAIPDNRPPGSHGPILIRRCDLPRKPRVSKPKLDPVSELAELVQNARKP